MTRKLEYSYHCVVKHLSGVIKGIKEVYSKIVRDTFEKFDEMEEEDIATIKKSLDDLRAFMKDLIRINYSITSSVLEDKRDLFEDLDTLRKISIYRTTIEKIMKNLLRIYKKYNLSEEKSVALFNEFLEILGDLYKIEQDHYPEIEI